MYSRKSKLLSLRDTPTQTKAQITAQGPKNAEFCPTPHTSPRSLYSFTPKPPTRPPFTHPNASNLSSPPIISRHLQKFPNSTPFMRPIKNPYQTPLDDLPTTSTDLTPHVPIFTKIQKTREIHREDDISEISHTPLLNKIPPQFGVKVLT